MFKLLSTLLIFTFLSSSAMALPKLRGNGVATAADIPGGDITKLLHDNQTYVQSLGELLSDAISKRDISAQSFGTSIQMAEQRAENEHFGLTTDPLDFALSNGFSTAEFSPYALSTDTAVAGASYGFLMANYTASTTIMFLAWNPMCLVATTGLCSDTTEKGKTEVTTGWTAENAGTTLALNSSLYVLGVKSLSFAKTTGNTNAGIVKDLGVGTGINVNNNTDLWYAVHLPSITDVVDVATTIDIDGTNTCTFLSTTDYQGNPLAVGWNWIEVDLSGTCASVGGSGWNMSQTFRYFHAGIDTGSSATTISPILVDAIMFASPKPDSYIAPGDELGISGATYSKFTFDASNTKFSGPVVIANPPSASFGADNTYVNSLDRGLIVVNGDNSAIPVSALTNQESYYQKTTMKAPVSNAKLTISANVNTPISLTVLTHPTTSQITVDDPSDYSGAIVSGTTMDVFRLVKKQNGKKDYVSRNIALAISSSSASSGITTINTSNSNSGIQNGDVVVFRHASAKYSLTGIGTNENFSTATFQEAIGYSSGLSIPNLSNLYALWNLNGNSNKNFGVGPNLTVTGGVTFTSAFKNGQTSASNFSTSRYLQAVGSGVTVGNPALLSVSLWYYPASFPANDYILSTRPSGNQGWQIEGESGAIAFFANTINVAGGSMILNSWNHIAVTCSNGGTTNVYLNGTLVATGTNNVTTGTDLTFGLDPSSGFAIGSPSSRMAQVMVETGVLFSSAQIKQLYNNGLSEILGISSALFKYRWYVPGLSGQQLSTRIDWTDNLDGFMTQQSAVLQ